MDVPSWMVVRERHTALHQDPDHQADLSAVSNTHNQVSSELSVAAVEATVRISFLCFDSSVPVGRKLYFCHWILIYGKIGEIFHVQDLIAGSSLIEADTVSVNLTAFS